MHISKQLYQEKYIIPSSYNSMSLSEIIKQGPFLYFTAPGLPIYLPLFSRLLNTVENQCINLSTQVGFDLIDIPNIFPNSALDYGEKIDYGFLDQFIFLSGRMYNYHLVSTSEPFFIEILQQGLQSYRQLPIRYFYCTKFFRQLRDVYGLLKSREFKMIGGISLHAEGDYEKEKSKFIAYMKKIEEAFSLKTYSYLDNYKGFYEYFYLHEEGGENFRNEKAISLAMFYQYGKNLNIKASFRNQSNTNSKPYIITFGLGLQRLLFILLDSTRDKKGFNLPKKFRPFDLSVICMNERSQGKAKIIYSYLHEKYSNQVILDDRKCEVENKTKLSDFIGIPIKILIGQDRIILEYRNYPNNKKILSFDSYTQLYEELDNEIVQYSNVCQG